MVDMEPSTGQNLWQPQRDDLPQVASQANTTPATPQSTAAFEPVNWEASESIHHERDGMWFVSFAAIFVVLIGISIWLQQWTFTVLLVIMALALVVYVQRPPRVVRYNLSTNGLHVGEQFHAFDEFRSFGVLQDGSLFSVMLMPTKRFGQALTIYFTENDGEKIVDILGSYLPMEDLRPDMMDTILRRLRL